MNFSENVSIRVSRKKVWACFIDSQNLYQWQPTLRDFHHVSGTPGKPGAKTLLVYDEGSRKIELTETITLCIENDAFAARYDSGMAVNTMHNRFVDTPEGDTRWEMMAKFEFRDFPWKYISFLFRGSIRNRLRADMRRFKEFVEQQEGVLPPVDDQPQEDEAAEPEADPADNRNSDNNKS